MMKEMAPQCFCPRSRMGSDERAPPGIHFVKSFDPRSRTGSDKAQRPRAAPSTMFRSTLPHGSDGHLFNTLRAQPKAHDQREPPVRERRRLEAFRSKDKTSHDFKKLFLRELP